MKKSLKKSLERWNWRAQSIWEWEDKLFIPQLINRIEGGYYKTKNVKLDLKVYNLQNDSFQCENLFEFLQHYMLVQEADTAYPVIINNMWQVIDGRHRICKAILMDKKSIKAIQVIDSSIV